MPIPRVDADRGHGARELDITLAEALEQSADLKKAYDTDGEIRELFDLAMKIEGLARNVGTHAAAVVIADRAADRIRAAAAACRTKRKSSRNGPWGTSSAAGLLKMDFLGLRNLTILSKAVDLIEQTTGERVDPYKFPLDDRDTFALLCRGETKGIFQLESGGIRDLLQKMKPDHFRDIIATNALYRPGPLEGGMVDDYVQVKHGRKQAGYKHPVMKEVLEETHGVMVYQEQVMRILNRLGGIELPNAYTCIKAISKKKLPDDRQVPRASSSPAPAARADRSAGRRTVRHDRKVRRLRLQQEPFDRLRPDRLHDGLSQGPLSAGVHGGLALGRHGRPQFQEERLARRASRRLPADGTSRWCRPDVNRSDADFTVADGQDSVRPGGDQRLRR